MTDTTYNQFCPVAMAAEILCSRWTMVLLRELVVGSTRFNELRRGLPRMSPALLSKRLKELEGAGIVERVPVLGEAEILEYRLTDSGRELRPIIEAVGVWGQRWVSTEATLKNLDPNLLMWDMRRNIDPTPLPPRRTTIHFIYNDLPATQRHWWLVIGPDGDVDLCALDPGHDVDLYVATDLRTMTEIWMGYTTLAQAMDVGRLAVTGNRTLEATLPKWLKLSTFARIAKVVP